MGLTLTLLEMIRNYRLNLLRNTGAISQNTKAVTSKKAIHNSNSEFIFKFNNFFKFWVINIQSRLQYCHTLMKGFK